MDNSVRYEHALPDDTDVDDFESGNAEVDRYFRERHWVRDGKASPPTYKFWTADGELLAFAALAFRKLPHPDSAAVTKARYATVYAAGCVVRFHGAKALNGESLAYSVFRELERLARKNSDCVGMSLQVRSSNARAISFYRKFGFEQDPGIARDDGTGDPHLAMRKLF